MNTNGNGKVNPALVTAQQATEAALKPLREAEKRVATTRLRLSECEQVLAQAEQDYDAAQGRWIEDDSPAHKQALRQTHDDAAAARTRVDGFKRKLAAEEAALAPLRATHNDAMVALAKVQLDANIAHLEEEWSAARNAVVVLEGQLAQAARLCAEAERRYKTMAAQKREGEQRESMRDAHVRFRQNNPSVSVERVRQGF